MNKVNNYMRIDPEYPDTWGASFWITAHSVAAAYPIIPTDDDMSQYKQFYDSFQFILPCSECREHWNDVIQKRPLTDAVLTSRTTLSRWVLDTHNMVNSSLGKTTQFSWKQLCHRYVGIEETTNTLPKKKNYIVNSSKILQDKSLGTVQSSAPPTWRPVMKSIKAIQPNVRAIVPSSTGAVPKKRCGCANKK